MTIHFLHEIDAAGRFVEDIIFDDEDGALTIPSDLIGVAVPGGFYKPKWDGSAWVEGQDPAVVSERIRTSANAAIYAEINALEAAAMIPRVSREFMLGIALKEALAAGYTEAQFIAVNIGYAKLKAQDDQIKTLRAQLV